MDFLRGRLLRFYFVEKPFTITQIGVDVGLVCTICLRRKKTRGLQKSCKISGIMPTLHLAIDMYLC